MVDAVVLAGSPNSGPLKECSPVPYEALIPIGPKAMVQYVVEALLAARGVGRVVVVGPRELEGCLAGFPVELVPPGKDLLENVLRALERLPGAGRVLVASSDIPLLTPRAVEDFLEQCRGREADLYYPVVPREAVERSFPGPSRRTYVRLRDGVFTGGNLFLVNPEVVPRCLGFGQRFIAARKSPWKLCRLLGAVFLLRYLLRRLSIEEARDRVSRLMGIRGEVVISRYAEVGVDVDKPADLEMVAAVLRG
ncbi:nucleotidyltransferase family protein [Desulfovirgula thermocuniculi]|uniref:nucleotidyltransferase family protein n=1 Tax=Desulfovirgula thermocuniculi TaxID=348842 RepID=UPI00040F7BCC|nr:nucleotidyltransferase family protein [Desulfovirgula thermocuniculi]